MESANLHHQHHQLQGQLVIPSSSLLTSPSTYGATATASPHAWTQNFTLSSSSTGAAGNLNIPNCNGVSLNQRQKNERIVSPLDNSMIHQDLSFNWNQPTHDDLQQLSKIKQELSSSDSFPKFTDMLNTTSSSSIDQEDSSSPTSCYIKDDQKDHNITDLSENLLLKTISSGFPINAHHQFSPPPIFSSFGSSMPNRTNFSQIYPSINISNLNRSPPTSISLSNSFDINLQALDLLTSTRYSASFGHPSHDNDNLAIYNGLDRVQLSTHMQSCSPGKVSSFAANELTEAKRPNNSLMEPKATQAAPKKSRLDSRASCPPFKVRKEKLGDRIAALQQLVAPFGKTDTASVLMEAIGYIKFLQNQVETLSVPYMKSSRNKTSTLTTQAFQGSTAEEVNGEAKKDLRSRGLCLVPLSCMSYVTGDGNGGTGGGSIWPPPNFGGGT